MKKSDLTLFLEINNYSLIFFVLKKNEIDENKIINELSLPVSGVEDKEYQTLKNFIISLKKIFIQLNKSLIIPLRR